MPDSRVIRGVIDGNRRQLTERDRRRFRPQFGKQDVAPRVRFRLLAKRNGITLAANLLAKSLAIDNEGPGLPGPSSTTYAAQSR